MKPRTALAAAALAAVAFTATPAGAQPADPDQYVTETIGTFPTPADDCQLVTANNDSVHIGNILQIDTGAETVWVEGIEDEPNNSMTVPFTAGGPSAVVSVLVFQDVPDPITSLEVAVTCSTTPTTPPTTPPPPPPTGSTTTTSHPDTGGTDPAALWFGLAGLAGLAAAATRLTRGR